MTVPELSPSDPTSNASSPSSSVPVTPLDPPPFAPTQADPLAHGKHQPDPRPFRPVSKSTSRLGTVWRARQVLLGLGKRKRRASAETGFSTGVDSELFTDYYDVPKLPDSNSAPEIIEPRASQPQSLFSLPNVPIDSIPPVRLTHIIKLGCITHLTYLASANKYAGIIIYRRSYGNLRGAAAQMIQTRSHQPHRAQ